MLKIIGKQNARAQQAQQEEEEKRKLEEEKKGEDGSTGEAQQVQGVTKVKKSPGEIRLRKDLQELDLPSHAAVNFPD